jgi:predicted exporter
MPLEWRKRWFFIALPILLASIFFTADFKTDISAFFIAGESAEEILLASEMQSGALSSRYILSISTDNKEAIAPDFAALFKAEIAGIDGVIDVWSPGQSKVAVDAVQAIYSKHASHLFSRSSEHDLDDLLTEKGLGKRAAMLKKALLSPQAAIVKKIVKHDPLLISLASFKSLQGQFQNILKKDQRYQNLILQTQASGLDVEQQKRIQEQIKAKFSNLKIQQKQAYSLLMTGVPVFATHTQELIQGDITRVSILSSIFITLLFIWIFRSYKTLFWTASLMVAVVGLSILVTNLVFGYVHGITMAIGSTLIGICIDYPIHALVHSQAIDTANRTTVISRVWPSMVLGGMTTMIGYVALGFSGYPGFQQIAVYAGTGILVSLLLTRYVLPALIAKEKISQTKLTSVDSWIGFCERYRLYLSIIVMLILGFAVSGMNNLRWIDDMQQLTPELDQLKTNDRIIRSRMLSSIEPGRFVLVSGSDIETALQKAEQVYQVLDQLKEQGSLHDYFGLYPWLLSAKQQRENQQVLQERLNDDVKASWGKHLANQGLSVKRLGQFDYANTNPLKLAEVLDSPVKRLIENQIVVTDQQILIMIWLAEHQPEALLSAFSKVPNVQYFSQRDLLNSMASSYQERAQVSLTVGIIVIVLLLLVRYKNLWITLQTLLPAILAAIFILAGWSLIGQAVSFLHLVGFLLAVAICVDYGIFYRENRGGNIALTYRAMAASMLTSAMAFGCLAVADTSALKTLAQVVAFGVVLGFLLCPVIIRNPDTND